jgi:hypothetical protein
MQMQQKHIEVIKEAIELAALRPMIAHANGANFLAIDSDDKGKRLPSVEVLGRLMIGFIEQMAELIGDDSSAAISKQFEIQQAALYMSYPTVERIGLFEITEWKDVPAIHFIGAEKPFANAA